MIRNPIALGLAAAVPGVFLLVAPGQVTPESSRQPRETEAADAGARPPSSSAGLELFRSQVRHLLAGRCLRCHEPNRRDGGLDLSRRSAALSGGDSGPAIVPGDPGQSLLCQLVTAAEMPPDFQNLLSSSEIAALEQWIELGAPYDGEPMTPTHLDDGSTQAPGQLAMCPCMRTMMEGMSANSTGLPDPLPLAEPLRKDQARERAEHHLKSLGNPLLKLGQTNETITAWEVEVTTKEGSLVNWIIVDKHTGRIRLLF